MSIAVITMYWTRVWFVGFLGRCVVGLAQWLLLRKYLFNSIYWMMLTFGGWLISYRLIMILYLSIGMIGSWSETSKWIELALIFGAISGALVGFFQQLVLIDCALKTRQWICSTTVWTLVTTVSGALGVAVTLSKALSEVGGWTWLGSVSWVETGGVIGVMYGLMTGGVMVWLLRQIL